MFYSSHNLPPSPLNEKSVVSVLRKIEFKLNKTFLKSAFTKYKETDRFRFFIFPEDKNIDLQHFHVLLFSPRKRDKEFNTERCIACKFREEPYFLTCPHCTSRVLYELIAEELQDSKMFVSQSQKRLMNTPTSMQPRNRTFSMNMLTVILFADYLNCPVR